MQPIDYAGALKRGWRLVVAAALVVAVIAVLVPSSQAATKGKVKGAPKLHWTSNAWVGSPPAGGGSLVGGGVTSSQILFYANSFAVRQATAKAVGLTVPPSELIVYMGALSADSTSTAVISAKTAAAPKKVDKSGVVLLISNGSTKAGAIKLANGYAKEIGTYLNQLAAAHPPAKKGSSGTTSPVPTGYQIILPALVASRTTDTKASLTSSRKVRGLAGLVVGALIGAAILLARELLDKRIRSASKAESSFGYPVVIELAAPVLTSEGPESVVDLISDPTSPEAESYRMLRMSVMFEQLATGPKAPDDLSTLFGPTNGSAPTPAAQATGSERVGERRVILVVSPRKEPTRPQVAANLAASYAEAGQRVVVISTADLANGANRGNGTSGADAQAGVGPAEIEARLEPTVLEHVFRLPLRGLLANSGQLVNRGPMILEAAKSVADAIIIEAPSILDFHHADALLHSVDVVVVVGECGLTTMGDARKSGDQLQRMGAPVLGVVVTNVRATARKQRGPSADTGSGGQVPSDPAEAPEEDDLGEPTRSGPPMASSST